MTDQLDLDGYPTAADLDRIEAWRPDDGVAAWLDYVASLWHWPDFGVSRKLKPEEALLVHAEPGERFLRLATGGWSGNESLIIAMEANHLLWAFTWQLSARGGLSIYRYPTTGQMP